LNTRRVRIAFFISVVIVFVLFSTAETQKAVDFPMSDYYIAHAYEETASINIVTAIYLNYRYYDTLFEALMLLFSIIGIIYMSHAGEDEEGDDDD